MKPMLNFTPSMTHPFLKFAENAHIVNQMVLQLIDELRMGLSEEEMIQNQKQTNRLYYQEQKNVMTCYCIMLHIQCLAYMSDNNEQYNHFINEWKSLCSNHCCAVH